MNGDSVLIEATGLQRVFDGDRPNHLIFNPFSLPRAKIVAIIGPSGTGKTTLLNILAGIDPLLPAKSEARAWLWPVPSASPIDILDHVNYPRHLTASIFQRGYLLPNASIGLNVAAPMALAGKDVSDEKVITSLQDVGFPRYEAERLIIRRPWQVSGGQAQRIAIARALSRDPKVLFADEPTSSLDEDARDRIMETLSIWLSNRADRTLVLVSHDLELVARHADKVVLLHSDTPAVRFNGHEELTVRATLCPEGASAEDLNKLIRAASEHRVQEELGVDDNNNFNFPAEVLPERTLAPAITARGHLISKLVVTEMLTPRARPATPQSVALHQEPLKGPPNVPPAGGVGRLANSLGRWQQQVNFFTLVRHFTSMPEISGVVISFLSIVVALVSGLLLWGNFERLNSVLSDPRNCSVQAFSVREQGRPTFTADVVDSLASRPWNIDMPEERRIPSRDPAQTLAPASCSAGPAAFRRFDTTLVSVIAADAMGECHGPELASSVLAAPRNDPILQGSRVVSVASGISAASGQSLHDFLARPLIQSRDLIFVTTSFQQRLQQQGLTMLPSRLCLRRGLDTPVPLQLGGIVDEIPGPRLTAYEIYVPEPVFLRVAYGAEGPTAPPPSVVLYYDQGGLMGGSQHRALEGFAEGRFALSEDVLRRSERLRSEARSSMVTVLILLFANFGLFVAISHSMALNYLKANAPQLAVMRTFGLKEKDAYAIGINFIFYKIGLSSLPLFVLIVTTYFFAPISLGENIVVTPTQISVTFSGLLAVYGAIVLTSVHFATSAWWRSEKLLSECLN